jgi:hypothetical protein
MVYHYHISALPKHTPSKLAQLCAFVVAISLHLSHCYGFLHGVLIDRFYGVSAGKPKEDRTLASFQNSSHISSKKTAFLEYLINFLAAKQHSKPHQ